MMKPSVGRVVHFYSQQIADRDPSHPGYGFNGQGAGPYPAMIVQSFPSDPPEDGYCNLVVQPFDLAFNEGSVAQLGSKHAQEGRYWVEPPRV